MTTKYNAEMKTLNKFYKNFFSWQVTDLPPRLGCAIFAFILFIMMCIPYRNAELEDFSFHLFLMAIWMTHLYLAPYMQFVEEKKVCRIYEKIKYLPISLQAFRFFLIKKFGWFCLRLTMIFLAVQLLFTYLAYHQIFWHNVAVPLLFGFVSPMVIGYLEILILSSK